MKMTYQTERLELKILDDTACARVLQFYLDNREMIEQYETDRPPQFYTEQFQKMLLQGEYNLAVKQKSLRFWFSKSFRDAVFPGSTQASIRCSFNSSNTT